MGLSFAGIDAAQGQGQKPILVNDSANELPSGNTNTKFPNAVQAHLLHDGDVLQIMSLCKYVKICLNS